MEREPRPDDPNLEEFATIISLISGERDRISQLIRESPGEENKERLASVAHLDTIISKLKSKLQRSG